MPDNFLQSSLGNFGDPGGNPNAPLTQTPNIASMIAQMPADPSQGPSGAPAPQAAPAPDPSQAAPQLVGGPGAATQDPTQSDVQNLLQNLPGGNANAASPAPRQRQSLLDTIGRLSDVFAKVGGAAPLYQSTVDESAARQNAAQDRVRALDLASLQRQGIVNTNTKATGDLTDDQNNRIGAAMRGVQAIQKGGGTPQQIQNAWAAYASAHGIPADVQAQIAKQIADDPKNIDGFVNASTDPGDMKDLTGGAEKFSLGQPITIRNPKTGEVRILQAKSSGGADEIPMPDGFVPVGTVKTVKTGGVTHVLNGAGQDIRAINSATELGKDERPVYDENGNITGAQVIPGSTTDIKNKQTDTKIASAQATAAAKAGDPYTAYTGSRSAIKNIDDALADLSNDPDLQKAVGYGYGALDTPARKNLEAKIARVKGIAIPVAAAILRSQGLQRVTQKEITTFADGLTSDIGLLRQSPQSFQANIGKSRQTLYGYVSRLDGDALRNGTIDNHGQPVKRSSSAPPAGTPLPPRLGATRRAPTVSNW